MNKIKFLKNQNLNIASYIYYGNHEKNKAQPKIKKKAYKKKVTINAT